MMAATDVAHALKLVAAPHAAGGVVGVAEEQHGGALVGTASLQVVVVDDIAVGLALELTLGGLAAAVAYRREEAVVDGGEDNHLLTGQGERLDGTAHGCHHTGGVEYPATVDVPLVAAVKPVDDGVVVAVVGEGVAIDGMGGAALHSLAYGGSHLEVHIGHPHGQLALAYAVPLHTAGTETLGGMVKIKCCHCIFIVWLFLYGSRGHGHSRRR